MGLEIVDIHVGPQKKLFRIHRGILCDKVPYFQKMFSSGFVEGLEGKAFFPEDDPNTFISSWVGYILVLCESLIILPLPQFQRLSME